MSGEHSTLAPSSAHIRVKCAGSRSLQMLVPELEESEESREGTAAHWAASELLYGRTIDTGLIAPNGVMLTDEMIEGAEMYAQNVRATDVEFAGFPAVIEERVDISSIHPECWGTPDAWRFKPYRLIVWDYKFGHRYVEIFENWQLIEYTAGILDKVGINGISDDRTEVVLRVVQPRCYVGGSPIREWSMKASDLRGYFNKLRQTEDAAMQPNAPVTVNEHCRDCTAKHICQASQRAAYGAMDVASSNVPFNLNNEALGAELRYIDRALMHLTARQTGLVEQALATIRRGQHVPFYKIEHGQSRKRWAKPDAEVLALGEMIGLNLAKPKLLTPNQAITAGLDQTLVDAYSEIPQGEGKLKPDDGLLARKVFGIIS